MRDEKFLEKYNREVVVGKIDRRGKKLFSAQEEFQQWFDSQKYYAKHDSKAFAEQAFMYALEIAARICEANAEVCVGLKTMEKFTPAHVQDAQSIRDAIKKSVNPYDDSPVHGWFGLTYSSYLVLPRMCMQEMSALWQQRIVDLLDEAHRTNIFPSARYSVQRRDENGRFIKDPFANYRHGSIEQAKIEEKNFL